MGVSALLSPHAELVQARGHFLSNSAWNESVGDLLLAERDNLAVCSVSHSLLHPKKHELGTGQSMPSIQSCLVVLQS